MKYRKISILLLISLIIFPSACSYASPTQPDPFTEVVLNADLIVLGTFTDLKYEVVNFPEGKWGGRHVYTIFTLSVEKVMKGDPDIKEVFIKVEGGYMGEVLQVPMGPYFSITDKILVCLIREAGNVYTIPYELGMLWIEGARVSMKPGLEVMMGRVAKIMLDNNIPIALDEPIPIPAEPHQRPEN